MGILIQRATRAALWLLAFSSRVVVMSPGLLQPFFTLLGNLSGF